MPGHIFQVRKEIWYMLEKTSGRTSEWARNHGTNGDMRPCRPDSSDRFGDILFCLLFESRMCVNSITGSVGWDIVHFIQALRNFSQLPPLVISFCKEWKMWRWGACDILPIHDTNSYYSPKFEAILTFWEVNSGSLTPIGLVYSIPNLFLPNILRTWYPWCPERTHIEMCFRSPGIGYVYNSSWR